jgi:hypothetical protein
MKQKLEELSLDEAFKLANAVENWDYKKEETGYPGEYTEYYSGSFQKVIIDVRYHMNPRPYEGYATTTLMTVTVNGAEIGGYLYYHREEEGQISEKGDKKVGEIFSIIKKNNSGTKEKGTAYAKSLLAKLY